MSTSKSRLRWHEAPMSLRAAIEQVVGAPVVRARTCPGGFSPGFASRLALADGRRVFVKAMDADAWPLEAPTYRAEARVAAALPSTIPAPRLLGTLDDGRWIVLAFEDIDGAEPARPWRPADLDRVVAALDGLARVATPSPVALPRGHPRLGGWAELAGDRHLVARLPAHAPWAAEHLGLLIALEEEGLAAAQGSSLVHFDLYPHNILLAGERVVFVDWPHARLGTPVVDLVMMLSSAATDGVDPEPFLARHAVAARGAPAVVDAVLAAHAGFCVAGGLYPLPPGLAAIGEAKLSIGRGAVDWLRRRLAAWS